MQTEITFDAIEEYQDYDNDKLTKVCFVIKGDSVIISGLDNQYEVVDSMQLEISKKDFIEFLKMFSTELFPKQIIIKNNK